MRALLIPIAGLAWAPLATAQSAWKVEPVDIRPAGDDFAPALQDSNLVFSSVRPRAQVVTYTDASNGMPLADLYRVRLHNGLPGRPQLMDGRLNSLLNDGPASFSPGGDTICITRNLTPKGRKRQGQQLGLFFSVRQGGTWSEPLPFEHNGMDCSVMHGSFSPDGRTLYFASNRPGGNGGADLYLSRREGNGWGTPQNLGPAVNTAANELFPNMNALGELHFASNREGGPGALDIYRSRMDHDRFTPPEALPEPINSTANDFGWAPYADGISGFFSTERDGQGKIFRFHRQPIPFQDCLEQKPTELCYHFEDEGSFQADTLPLRYEWDFGDGHRQRGLETEHCFASPGIYTVRLNIIDTLSESIFFNETTYELEVLADVQAVIGQSAAPAIGIPVIFDATQSNLPGFTAREVHWDLGGGTVLVGDTVRHVFPEAGGYRVRMDLIGGPDGKGGFEHHCVYRDLVVTTDAMVPATPVASRVAEKPARDDFAYRYVELPNDLFTVGETDASDVLYSVQLLSSTERIAMDDARFIPIRKQYAITERFQPKQQRYTYSIGQNTTPTALYRAFSFARQHGFTGSIVEVMPQDKPVSIEEAEVLSLSELDQGVISVSKVLFESGKSELDPGFMGALDHVLRVVRKYPQLELVIEAHTDNVGKDAKNLALSKARAREVVDYFIQAGIDASRLRPIGFGAARPVADNRTEAGRAQNRRVDFRLNVPGDEPLARP